MALSKEDVERQIGRVSDPAEQQRSQFRVIKGFKKPEVHLKPQLAVDRITKTFYMDLGDLRNEEPLDLSQFPTKVVGPRGRKIIDIAAAISSPRI